jgi:hypothetical protein
MSLSVRTVQCPSRSVELWNVEDTHSPPNPMSSRTSSKSCAVSTVSDNFGFVVKVRKSICADCSVTEFWLDNSTSSSMLRIGPELVRVSQRAKEEEDKAEINKLTDEV